MNLSKRIYEIINGNCLISVAVDEMCEYLKCKKIKINIQKKVLNLHNEVVWIDDVQEIPEKILNLVQFEENIRIKKST